MFPQLSKPVHGFLWDRPIDYVLQEMPAYLLQMPILLWLAAASAQARPGAVAELPNGSSAAFRERMMAWSAPSEPAAPVLRIRQAQAPAATKSLPRLSSRFGYRRDPLQGTSRMHSGIDIPGPLGTPIQASASGFVRFAGTAGGYGRMVEIDHGNGLTTRYAHLSRILVQPYAPVARGETIALMGSTGRSTGSHLHFEVRAQGRAANPLAYLGGEPARAYYTVWQPPSEPHISQFARSRAAAKPLSGERF